MGRERTEGERLAAREFADAVRTEAERFFDAMIEEVRRNPGVLGTSAHAPLTEEEADRLALAAVRRTRGDSVRRIDASNPPSEAEVAEWVGEREQDRGTRPRVWKPLNPH